MVTNRYNVPVYQWVSNFNKTRNVLQPSFQWNIYLFLYSSNFHEVTFAACLTIFCCCCLLIICYCECIWWKVSGGKKQKEKTLLYHLVLNFLAFSNWPLIQLGFCCSMLCMTFWVIWLGLLVCSPMMPFKHIQIKLSFSLLHLSREAPVKSSTVFPSSNIRHIITIKFQTSRLAFFKSTKFSDIFLSDRKKKYLIGGGKHAITVGNLLITIDTAWAASLVKPGEEKKEKAWLILAFVFHRWVVLSAVGGCLIFVEKIVEKNKCLTYSYRTLLGSPAVLPKSPQIQTQFSLL